MDTRIVSIITILLIVFLWNTLRREETSSNLSSSVVSYSLQATTSKHTPSIQHTHAVDEIPPKYKTTLPGKICSGWCPPKLTLLDRVVRSIDCSTHTIQEHVRASLQLENCPVAVQSEYNARLVETKLIKLQENDAFTFFRGAAAYFDIDLMCLDPNFQGKKKNMPRVVSNGDAHPENFGTQVMVNGKLVWGVNDFDQSFPTPFSWDLKRGATGTEVACKTNGWNDVICRASVDAFIGSYLSIAAKRNVSKIKILNDDRYVEGSRASNEDPLLVSLFRRARRSETDEEIISWLHDDLNVDVDKDKFFQTDVTTPLPESEIPHFQAVIDAYLYHGVPALMVYPNGEFWKVLSVAKRAGSGTGSIGLNRFYILLRGKKSTYGGRIVLEMKQEMHSLLEMFFRYKFTETEQGKRAVDAERGAYPYTNPFYGWTTYQGHAYIIREKSKHEKSVRLEDLTAQEYVDYSQLCGRALAIYHFKMQCGDHVCNLEDPAAIDYETWQSVSDYINDFGVVAFHEMVNQFAFKETERQLEAWEWLSTVVRQSVAQNISPLWLLNFQMPGVDSYC